MFDDNSLPIQLVCYQHPKHLQKHLETLASTSRSIYMGEQFTMSNNVLQNRDFWLLWMISDIWNSHNYSKKKLSDICTLLDRVWTQIQVIFSWTHDLSTWTLTWSFPRPWLGPGLKQRLRFSGLAPTVQKSTLWDQLLTLSVEHPPP